jgi:hypothetical protein
MINESDVLILFERHCRSVKSTGSNQYVALCPLHDDSHHSFSFNTTSTQYYCFACGEKGNAVKFAKHFGEDPKPFYSDDYRGLDKDGAKEFPYFDKNGTVSGIKHHKPNNGKSSWWEGDGKLRWYNEWMLDTFPKDKPLYIAEGEGDAQRLRDIRFNAVSGSGGAMSVPHIPKIFSEFKEIIILYDNDDAGRKGAKKCAEEIYRSTGTLPYIGIWRDGLPEGYDISDDEDCKEIDYAIKNKQKFEIIIPNKIGGFTIMTDKRTSTSQPAPTEWLIENILPMRFNSIIAGTTGSKKSFWTMQLGMSLANCELKFCGNKIHTEGLRVLYVDCENGNEEYIRRFHRIKKHMDWKDNGNWLGITKTGTTEDIYETIHEICEKYFKPDLIIIDSLYNSTAEGDLSKSHPMSRITNQLVAYKEKYDATILVVHHFNKWGDEFGLSMQRMSGSSVLQNWLEWCVLMTKTNIPNFNLWTVGKTRGTYHDNSVVGLQFNDFWFTTKGVVEDWKPFLLSEQKKAKWTNVLEDLPPEFDTQMWFNVFSSKNPTMTERTARLWLSELSHTPMLEKLSHGLYRKGVRLITEENLDEE